MTMLRKEISARYLRALRAHLRKPPGARCRRAQTLGEAVVAGGLATLDLAIVHEQAMLALASTHDFARTANGALKRSGLFFTAALVPLEAAHRATRQTVAELAQRNETLHLHATALAHGKRRLEREIARRKAGEAIIREAKERYKKLFARSQLMQRKLQLLTHQIISAQEEERKEISRELHDEVVQTLVGINVELSALGKGASAGVHAFRAKIASTQRLVENSVNAVHRFARELRPAVLDDLGLIPALHAYSKSLAARKRIKINLTAFAGVEALGSAERTVLYRVAQEALTNVVRHSRASLVELTLRAIPGAIRMEIRDNGKSFSVEKVLQGRNRGRLGLIGMRERVEMVGGQLTLDSAPNHGTTVRADIPFLQPKTKK